MKYLKNEGNKFVKHINLTLQKKRPSQQKERGKGVEMWENQVFQKPSQQNFHNLHSNVEQLGGSYKVTNHI